MFGPFRRGSLAAPDCDGDSGPRPSAEAKHGGDGGGGELAAGVAPPRAKSVTSMLGPRTWVQVDARGAAAVVRADRARLTSELGVQARDLRLLDPHFHASYPSAILCRDAALVVSMEHIKLIITARCVLVLNADDGGVAPFVGELSRRLAAAPASALPSADGSSAWGTDDGGGASPRARWGDRGPAPGETPFELRALEVALETVCAHLEGLAGDLEAAAHPALDDLTASVTTPNLERVRRVKTRLVRLTTRVETLREVLEKILDDDGDMHDMNLTARALDAAARAGGRATAGASPPPRSPLATAPSGDAAAAAAAAAVPAALEALEEEHERDEGEIAQAGGGGRGGGARARRRAPFGRRALFFSLPPPSRSSKCWRPTSCKPTTRTTGCRRCASTSTTQRQGGEEGIVRVKH